MTHVATHQCTACEEQVVFEQRHYRYVESGIPNVVLQNVSVAECPRCGNVDVSIPRLAKVHRAIAQALVSSPARLTGPQLRFLRKHLGLSGEDLSRYLHTDKTKISKWENEEDPIGPSTDRLIRLLATALDKELRPQVDAIAKHLPLILDKPGAGWELHVDVETLRTAFVPVSKAA